MSIPATRPTSVWQHVLLVFDLLLRIAAVLLFTSLLEAVWYSLRTLEVGGRNPGPMPQSVYVVIAVISGIFAALVIPGLKRGVSIKTRIIAGVVTAIVIAVRLAYTRTSRGFSMGPGF